MMTSRLINGLAASIIALGSLALSSEAEAKSVLDCLGLDQIVAISDIICGESATGFSITNISCSGNTTSWSVTCSYNEQ